MAIKTFVQKKNVLQSGVTLIELIIVIAIIAIVSSVVVFNFGDFTSNISLRSLAQETALAVRKAQTYATSVRGIDGAPPLYPAYGISFATTISSNPTHPSSKNFVLFANKPDSAQKVDTKYTPGSACSVAVGQNGECIQNFAITTEDHVEAICAEILSAGRYTCSSGKSIEQVDIIFNRPNPDAKIYPIVSGTSQKEASAVTIVLASQAGQHRIVTVYATGQISTQ